MTWTNLWFLKDSLYQGWYAIISVVSKEIQREGVNIAVRQSHNDLAILSFQSSLRCLLDYRYPGDLLLCPVLSNTLSFPGLSDDSPGPCFWPVLNIAYRHDCPLHPPAQRSQAVSPPAKSGLQMCVVYSVVLTFLKFTANI